MGDVHSASHNFFVQFIFAGSVLQWDFWSYSCLTSLVHWLFGEVFELSNILFSLICYLPKGSLRGSNVFFLSICDVFALIHLYSLTHIFVIYFKKRVKKSSKFLWVYNYQMCVLPICIVFFPQYPF